MGHVEISSRTAKKRLVDGDLFGRQKTPHFTKNEET